MRRRSRHARFGALGPRSRTLLVIGVTVVVLLTMPWLSLRYGGPNWVALSQSSSTIAQEPPFEDGTHLEATLLGVNEAPRADTAAYGTARFTINEDETRLAYRINVNNIDDITAVHIQLGDVGANGPIALTLFDGASAFDSDGAIAGTRDVSVTQANNFLAGDYYVNVLTADFPNGEIRGQIRPDDPVARRFDAHLDGDNEVPPVDTTADGDAQLFLSDDQTRLTYRISLEDIESVTTINIHRGQPDANGPIVHELVDEPDSFDPVSPITGTLTLTQDDRDDLSGGNYYINVSTLEQSAGQIRGQVEQQRQYWALEASLSGDQVAPRVVTGSSGLGAFVLNADQTELNYRITVANIEDVTLAHLRRGQPGEEGPIVFTLFDGTGTFDPDNPISDTLEVSAVDVDELLNGNYYINVETEAYPAGEIRGQITDFMPARDFEADLGGANEVPPVSTVASGEADFTFDDGLTHMSFVITVDDVDNITAAHIHRAPAGQNGPVTHTLFDGTGTFDPDNPVAGNVTLGAEDLADLLSGFFYINVHTSDHPAGEIRGQIGPEVYPAFAASLTGEEMVPAIDTDATGEGVFVLDEDHMLLHYRVTVEDIEEVEFAFIHRGQPGENGPLAHRLFGGTGDFDSDHPLSGTLELEASDVDDLKAGNYYVGIHTREFSGGEVRGQITAVTPDSAYEARLSGGRQVPPVRTSASGEGTFAFDDSLTHLSFVVMVTDIDNITAAHIHRGQEGQEGPVVHTLFDGTGAFDPDHPVAGNITLDAEGMADLLIDFYYVNVHTTAYPAGEIRGQIAPLPEYEIFLSLVLSSP